MKKFSASFIKAEAQSTFNKSSWTPVGKTYTLKEVWDELHPGQYDQIASSTAKVIAVEFEDGISLRIAIPIKDGSTIELKVGKCSLEEDDIVSIGSITAQELAKSGKKNIVRYSAIAVK